MKNKFKRFLLKLADKISDRNYLNRLDEFDKRHDRLFVELGVYEKALEQLGYKLEYKNPTHFTTEDEIPIPIENYGYKLVKLK